jgi:hypothetical protein
MRCQQQSLRRSRLNSRTSGLLRKIQIRSCVPSSTSHCVPQSKSFGLRTRSKRSGSAPHSQTGAHHPAVAEFAFEPSKGTAKTIRLSRRITTELLHLQLLTIFRQRSLLHRWALVPVRQSEGGQYPMPRLKEGAAIAANRSACVRSFAGGAPADAACIPPAEGLPGAVPSESRPRPHRPPRVTCLELFLPKVTARKQNVPDSG